MSLLELSEIGLSKLNSFQKNVLDECLSKESGGISLALGSGKTLLSIVLSILQVKKSGHNSILVIVSKTLIENWVNEIKKFFGDSLKYIILHQEYTKLNDFELVKDRLNFVIITPETLTKSFKDNGIKEKFLKYQIINEGRFNEHVVIKYNKPTRPYNNVDKGLGLLYSVAWGCIIVDEVQKYTNITSDRCRAIGSLCSLYRWVLSGTMFNEPKTERILGYHVIIDDFNFPRTLPDADKYIKNPSFKGFMPTIVHRSSNPSFKEPKVNRIIVENVMTYEESKVFLSMKEIISEIQKKVNTFKIRGDTELQRKFSTYLLAMITYLRQSLVCPLIPISNVALDMIDFKNKSELSNMLMDHINKLELSEWLNDEQSSKSTRIQKGLDIIDKHSTENITIFFSYRMCLDLFMSFIPSERKVFTISGNMNSEKRNEVLKEFEKKNENGFGNILLLTYEIGSEGLNIQCSNTVLLMDFQWSHGKSKQAIGRVLRYGQKATEVNVYLFTSNTAIERGIFDKQDVKLTIINELLYGAQKSKVTSMKIKDILQLIMMEDNVRVLNKIHSK